MTYAVVDVWIPSLGLVFDRFPADEDVDWGLPFEDGREFCLEGAGGAGFVGFGVIGLLLNPTIKAAAWVDIYEPWGTWGLEPSLNDDCAELRQSIPAGLVIPLFRRYCP